MLRTSWVAVLAAIAFASLLADRASAQVTGLAGPPPVEAVILPVGYEEYSDTGSIAAEYGNPASAAPGSIPPCSTNAAAACPASAPCAQAPCADCCCWPCECQCPPAACLPCPRVNLINPCWQLLVGGNITVDGIYNSGRPFGPGTPFFLTPRGPFPDDTFDLHARQTTMFFALMGPQVGNFRSGGLILFNLYNDAVIADRFGILPYQAYGELKNEDWRFAAGLQADVFAPLLPTVLPFSYLASSGNSGVFRGQMRLERFLYPTADSQYTFQAAISEPVSTIVANETLSEDNGWPNIELRSAWAKGQPQQVGHEAKRPFEVGISALVGQIRTIAVGPPGRVVADRWGVAGDFRWRINERWGIAGEVFTGQTIGSYGGGVFQNVNTATFTAVHATGGWGEVYYYLNPCLHTHVGYGVDDPRDADLAATQIARNQTVFANLIWDITQTFRVAGELTFRKTAYVGLPDNDSVGIHGQVQWKF